MNFVVLTVIQADEFVLSVDRFTPIFSMCSLIESRSGIIDSYMASKMACGFLSATISSVQAAL